MQRRTQNPKNHGSSGGLLAVIAVALSLLLGFLVMGPERRAHEIWGALLGSASLAWLAGRSGRVRRLEREIAELRQAKDGLETEALRLRGLTDISGDGIAIIDKEHRVTECNPRFAELLGYAPNEAIGLHTWQYDANLSEEVIRREFSNFDQASLTFETVHRRKDGRTLDVEVSGCGAMIGGEPFILAIVRDITERKRAEASLIEIRDKAEAANRTKSEFLATMSHEIRTPLNGVLGMLQLALTTDLTTEQQGYVETALQSGRSLLQVLSDILDISRIEAGALHIAAEDFRPADIFEPILRAFVETARRKGLTFSPALDPDLPESLHGDAGRIRQVLYNLVGNALKYTERGEVRLESFTLPEDGEPGRLRLVLAVSDTGIGVPGDKIRNIYDAFTQADGSHTRRFGGAGLGLSIVKRLVRLMGGDIAFCSQPGVGSEVLVILPLEPGATPGPATRPTSPQLPAARPGLDVLLAEDDPVNRLTVCHMLTKAGHRVHAVVNGALAVAYLASNGADCVLMDIQMPEMDGMEATRRIRGGEAGEAARSLPIVALTAHAMKNDRSAFLEAGMDEYIAKPVDMEELVRVLAGIPVREVTDL
jgi:PAS domain S-box-containing protein